MLDGYSSKLNDIMVGIFQAVLVVEEQMLKNSRLDLSISELHTIEAIGKHSGEGGCTISTISKELGVTLPTVTVAVKKLELKQCVEKLRGKDDGRMVMVALTKKGKKADAVHRYFHEHMVSAFTTGVSIEEKPVLLKALENLRGFLDGQITARPQIS